MTAVNVILRRDAAHVVSDGLTREVSGSAVLPRPKVLPIPHLNACLAARGDMLVLTTLYGIIVNRRATMLDAAEMVGQDLQETVGVLRQHLPQGLGPHNEVFLVGWPEEARYPCCYLADEDGRYGKPFTPYACGGLLMPFDAGDGRLAGRNLLDLEEPFDRDADAVALIEAQSAVADAGVGAFAQITTVWQDRIETRILHRWPDAISRRLGS